MIEAFFTNDALWLERWDYYLQETERGLYNQLSDWIQSYKVFGFESSVYLLTKQGTIIGGCGVVVAKFSKFKFLVVPCGPVIEAAYENELDRVITDLKKYAIKSECCYFQINVPFVTNGGQFHDYTLNHLNSKSLFFSAQEGTKFKHVIPLFGMRLVDLHQKTLEEVIQKFSSNHKRNLKKAEKYPFEFRFVTSEEEVEKAYECFILNAQQKGYPIRSYDSMKHTLMHYLSKDYAKIGCCFYEGEIVGAIYVIRCGMRLIYINGGVLKPYQDLPISVYMHLEIIKYSLQLNYKSYDVSVGGSDGVVRFKEGFGSELYTFENSRYWVLKPFYFKMYLFFEKRLKKHKQTIAKVLLFVKKSKFK